MLEEPVISGITLKDIPKVLDRLSEADLRVLEAQLLHLEKLKQKELARSKFIKFVEKVWPTFISGRHHKIMATAFERVARGECKRLIINMPPRHTKSEFASYLLPAWFLGQFPHKKVIQTSHTAELAVGFGRKVRNLVDSEVYHDIFPELSLQADSKAAGRWNTSKSGDYFAIGVGGAVTGKGADLLIIDDPHSEQEAALAQVNPEIYDKTYEWYTSGPRQRLQPGGAIVVVMCMTGDTPVLMADGSTNELRKIRPGDDVATYEDGKITTAKVLNHRSNGVDSVYTVRTQSGILVRANARHPFLVDVNGERKWTRLQDLKPGMSLVVTKDASAQQDRKTNRDFVIPAKPEPLTTERTRTRLTNLSATTGSGKAEVAPKKTVQSQQRSTGFVSRTTTSGAGPKATGEKTILQSLGGQNGSKVSTGSQRKPLTVWLKSVVTAAMSAVSRRLTPIPAPTGTVSSVSTTATTQASSGGCSATTATSQLGTVRPQKSCGELLNTYAVTTDQIVEIIPDGEEEVFDVQIERTENFIANGVISHNTRWSQKDLTGQVLKSSAQRGGEEWEVIEFPAIMPSGQPLWPEFWSLKELEALREELPNSKWQAQYQQQPTSDASAIIKREWWHIWEEDSPPHCEFIIQSWDTAFLKSERADYSACTTWGVFYKDDDTGKPQSNIILLNAFKKRMEFPELKQRAYQEFKEWEVDSLIVEAKAAGSPLIFELRAMGIPVQEFTPSKGNDKIARLNAVTDIFASGHVWVPNTRWAEELIEEIAAFPAGEHDDLVDSTTQALLRYRRGGFIRLRSDEDDEPMYHRKREYY